MDKTIFLLGAGFTKAAQSSAPINTELVRTLINHSGNASTIEKYQKLYGTNEIEILLTRLDMDAVTDERKRSDRYVIEAELVSYFRSLRFTSAALNAAPWLGSFANELLGKNDAIVTLNYDCFLEGLLDQCAVWTPNGGYYGVDNILVEAKPNPKGIIIYKIHGSEHFRVSAVTDRPEQDAIAYEFDGSIFPVSGAYSHFGGGIDSLPYLIAPSYVKLPHRQIALMMLKVLELMSLARNLVIIGCGLRPEDSFLWLLLSRFLAPRNKKRCFLTRQKKKRLVLVDPAAASISERIHQYWIGDVEKYSQVCLLSGGLEFSLEMLSSTLNDG